MDAEESISRAAELFLKCDEIIRLSQNSHGKQRLLVAWSAFREQGHCGDVPEELEELDEDSAHEWLGSFSEKRPLDTAIEMLSGE